MIITIFLVNWEDIKTEIICSNVIQKNNILFAKKLDKTLLAVAKEGDKKVSTDFIFFQTDWISFCWWFCFVGQVGCICFLFILV